MSSFIVFTLFRFVFMVEESYVFGSLGNILYKSSCICALYLAFDPFFLDNGVSDSDRRIDSLFMRSLKKSLNCI